MYSSCLRFLSKLRRRRRRCRQSRQPESWLLQMFGQDHVQQTTMEPQWGFFLLKCHYKLCFSPLLLSYMQNANPKRLNTEITARLSKIHTSCVTLSHSCPKLPHISHNRKALSEVTPQDITGNSSNTPGRLGSRLTKVLESWTITWDTKVP